MIDPDAEIKKAYGKHLRRLAETIKNLGTQSLILEDAANLLDPPDVPEPSRSSHYS